MPKERKQFGSADDIEHAFYDAIGRADLDDLMELWADDEEIVCVHPDGTRLIGYTAIRAAWADIFTRGGVHIHPVQLHASQNVMSAVHNLIESIGTQEGRTRDAHIIATNVYIKTPLGWRIVVHHASIAPGRHEAERVSTTILH